MEKCKLLRLLIFCNCITLSVQIFGMENESDKEVLNWEEKGYDHSTKGSYCGLNGIDDFETLKILGSLILKFRSVPNGKSINIRSTNSKKVLDNFVKASKKSGTLEIKFLTDRFKKYCEGKHDYETVLKPTLTLDVPPSWNKKIILNQLKQVEGCLFVNGNGLLNIEATDTPIEITGKSMAGKAYLTLKDGSILDISEKHKFFVSGKVYLEIDDLSQACLSCSDETTFIGNVQRTSSLVLCGKNINIDNINCDLTSMIRVNGTRKKINEKDIKRKKKK